MRPSCSSTGNELFSLQVTEYLGAFVSTLEHFAGNIPKPGTIMLGVFGLVCQLERVP